MNMKRSNSNGLCEMIERDFPEEGSCIFVELPAGAEIKFLRPDDVVGSSCRSCDFLLDYNKKTVLIEVKNLVKVSEDNLDGLIKKAICQMRCSLFLTGSKNIFYLFLGYLGELDRPDYKELVQKIFSRAVQLDKNFCNIKAFCVYDEKELQNRLRKLFGIEEIKITIK